MTVMTQILSLMKSDITYYYWAWTIRESLLVVILLWERRIYTLHYFLYLMFACVLLVANRHSAVISFFGCSPQLGLAAGEGPDGEKNGGYKSKHITYNKN